MNRFEMIADYPAYEVVKLVNTIKVYDGEILTDKKHLENWKLGSVVGYAVESGRDPIEAYNRALANGHETHYAYGMGACLTSNPNRREERRIEIDYGDKIEFHGQIFTIEKAPNHNINLKKVV